MSYKFNEKDLLLDEVCELIESGKIYKEFSIKYPTRYLSTPPKSLGRKLSGDDRFEKVEEGIWRLKNA